MTFEQEIGRLVARWRSDAGLSQESLGEAMGLQQGAISKIETGRQALNVRTLLTILNATGKSLPGEADRIAALAPETPTPLWERNDE